MWAASSIAAAMSKLALHRHYIGELVEADHLVLTSRHIDQHRPGRSDMAMRKADGTAVSNSGRTHQEVVLW